MTHLFRTAVTMTPQLAPLRFGTQMHRLPMPTFHQLLRSHTSITAMAVRAGLSDQIRGNYRRGRDLLSLQVSMRPALMFTSQSKTFPLLRTATGIILQVRMLKLLIM